MSHGVKRKVQGFQGEEEENVTLATASPYHLITLSPSHPVFSSSSSPCPLPVLSLSLSLYSSSPRPVSYLRISLNIPFLGHCILLTLVPVLWIVILILMYHLYTSSHLRPSSRPLVSPFVLISTCSLILDHVLPVFFSHHGHPSPGLLISPYPCFLSCTCTAWSVLTFSLVLILSRM